MTHHKLKLEYRRDPNTGHSKLDLSLSDFWMLDICIWIPCNFLSASELGLWIPTDCTSDNCCDQLTKTSSESCLFYIFSSVAKILDGGYNFCLNPSEQEIVGHFFTLILLQGEREESTQMLPQIKNFQEKIFISLKNIWKNSSPNA